MRIKSSVIILMALLLLVLPILTFVVARPALAEEGLVTKIVYPNKPSYEQNEVVVACCQFDKYIDIPGNLDKIKSMTIQAAEQGANIIVFGEYALENKDAPEPVPGPSSLAIAEIAKKYGVYVVYGLVEENVNAGPDDYPAYDSAAIIGPKGIIGVYRKTHLAPVELYEKGDGPVAFHTPWGPVGVTICYDNYSYHELHRTYALMGARLVLNVTNIFYTPDMKDNFFLESQFNKGLQSLIGENWSYIASANNLGWSKKTGLYSFGKSEIIGPIEMGIAPTYEPVYYAGPASDKDEEILMAKLDLSYTDKLRTWGKFFIPDPKHHDKPTFEVMTYINWWLPEDKVIVDKSQLNAPTPETGQATMEIQKIGQMRDIAVIVAGVLLLTTIVFAVLAFRPRKK